MKFWTAETLILLFTLFVSFKFFWGDVIAAVVTIEALVHLVWFAINLSQHFTKG